MESSVQYEKIPDCLRRIFFIYIMLKVQMTLLINSNMMMGRMKNNPDGEEARTFLRYFV
jgi:hypothetical protein